MNKLEQYQQHIVAMLEEFNQFCRQNEVEFILVGGSALGAYRHDGFIPWDDDVDIAMLRDDFEKMEQCMKMQNNVLGKLTYSPVEDSIIPEAPVGHLYDLNVVKGKAEYAPKIDIHPLDGVPEGRKERKLQKLTALIYYLGVYHLPAKNKGKMMRVLSKIVLTIIPNGIWKIINRQCKKYFTKWNARESSEICSLFGVAGYEREIMPREWLYPLNKHKFEQYYFNVPGDAEHYLSRLYGNWREIPLEENRVPAHDGFLHFEETV